MLFLIQNQRTVCHWSERSNEPHDELIIKVVGTIYKTQLLLKEGLAEHQYWDINEARAHRHQVQSIVSSSILSELGSVFDKSKWDKGETR